MARIRSIKPEFWTSEQVVNCSRDARLLFIGMWNFCDDAGRHKASYARLKMEVLAGDSVEHSEIAVWVRELLENKLIEEYEVDGEKYWEVTGWRHQRIDQPNVKHPGKDGEMTGGGPRRLGGKQRQLVYKRLAELHGEVCVSCGSQKNLAVDHIHPLSRGGSNEIENLQLLCKICNGEKAARVPAGSSQGTRIVRDGESSPELVLGSCSLVLGKKPSVRDKSLPCPHLEIITLYNEILPELQYVIPERWDGQRAKHLQARWRESPKHQSIEFWRKFFTVLRNYGWYLGQNDKGWKANLAWIVEKKHFDDLVEKFVSDSRRSGTAA